MENEEKYAKIRAEILGEESSEEGSGGSEEEEESEEDESEADEASAGKVTCEMRPLSCLLKLIYCANVHVWLALENQLKIHDRTETNMLNLRRTIYLTIMSSIDFEECAHKLMKLQLQQGEEVSAFALLGELSDRTRLIEPLQCYLV